MSHKEEGGTTTLEEKQGVQRFETVCAYVSAGFVSPTFFEIGSVATSEDNHDVITAKGHLTTASKEVDALMVLTEMTRRSKEGSYAVIDFPLREGGTGFSALWIRMQMRTLGWVTVALSEEEGSRVIIAAFHRSFPDSVYFVTSNPLKLLEMRTAIAVPHLHGCDFDLPELKHDSIEKIAEDKARQAYAIVRRPVLCTDGGIFMDAYDGFPGPNSKQAATKLKPEGLLKLLVEVDNRDGRRMNAAAYFDGVRLSIETQSVQICFATEPRGTHPSYPMDKILIPTCEKNRDGKTYAEMPPEDRVSLTELPALAVFVEKILSKVSA
jgi:XTP/dITP diphosphohydrolase